MGLSVVTPATIPTTLRDRVKEHVKALSGTAEDDLVDQYVAAAVDDFEEFTSRAVFETVFKLTLKDFPAGRRLELPRAPASAVASVQYYDEDGALQTFASSKYTTAFTDDINGFIQLNEDYDWPTVSGDKPEAVEVTFTAGYGTTIAALPGMLLNALVLYAGYLFDNRGVEYKGVGDMAKSPIDIVRERFFRRYKTNWI